MFMSAYGFTGPLVGVVTLHAEARPRRRWMDLNSASALKPRNVVDAE